jgi:membrane associated rhomboid family serine protease
MPFLNRLENSLGRFAIPGLIRYVVALNALTFILIYLNKGYASALALDWEKIRSGEIWRLVSWIFIPPSFSIIWILFALLILWTFGDMLESFWGTFRLNLFYFLGMFGCTVAALILQLAVPPELAGRVETGGPAFNAFLNLSIFFAVATLNPNYQILLFFILPIRIKWLALISLALLALQFFGAPLTTKVAMIVAFANYLVFFGPSIVRLMVHNRQTVARRARFEAAKMPLHETIHRCSVCDRTEVSNPELDFRVAADGHEYCIDHLPRRDA